MSIAANVSRIPTQRLETVPIIDGIPRKQRPMDVRMFGFDTPFPSTLERVIPEELQMAFNAPTKSCVRDPKAKARTPADVRELPNSYEFVVDMPGLKPGDVKVQLEEENVLVVSGERKREEEEGGGKYLRMERRMGKLMRRLEMPGDANVEAISAVCQDGVLTVTVEKVPPAEPKKPRTIEVKIG